jgi:hypothetical protein
MTTENRRKFLAAGGALAALSAVPKATADSPQMNGLYIHGLVWNRQLATPMNDWLIRLDAKVQVPIGNETPPAVPGFATIGDDFHDGVGSHVEIQQAALKGGQLTITGTITESKTPALIGQSVLIEGRVMGTSVQGLTVTIGGSVFTGAGLVIIAIIAILIG